MTRREAEALAVEALEYVLENDTDYMGPEHVDQFREALAVLMYVLGLPERH